MQGSSSCRTGCGRRAPDHGLTVVSFEMALVFVFVIVLVIVVHKKRSSGRLWPLVAIPSIAFGIQETVHPCGIFHRRSSATPR